MDDDETKQERKSGEQESSDRNAAAEQFSLYALGDELVEKLKLLNYEEKYANLAASHRTVSRDYFVRSTNVGEQFFIFTTLAAWLIQKAVDPAFAFPQEVPRFQSYCYHT
ncbi:unnamed protein product [Gongylonema pulchrum]|uniref:Uncharacterized protein n=1 Tax=Gongylonema pulchrum TaxID=637853 RepID=A0A183EFU8_9BILA|nr:unnamed protein product [Gongylonema pulchrum]